MTEKQPINFNNIALQNAVIAGALCIIYTLVLYLINIELVLDLWLFVAYAFIVAFKIITANVVRKRQNNFISFRQGIKYTFMITAVGIFMWIAFNTILFKYIDRDLVKISKEKAIERTIRFMEIAKSPEKEIEAAVAKAEAQDYEPSLKFSSMNYAGSCIVGFIYSLIISGIFYLATKHNDPELKLLASAPTNPNEQN
jgi:hypothetical protein